MTIKEIHSKVGSLSGYANYFLLVFLWLFLENVYTSMKPVFPESPIEPFLEWGVRIMIFPLISAGLVGGIHEKQRNEETSSFAGFFKGIKTHYWRMLGVNLFSIMVYVMVAVVFAIAQFGQTEFEDNTLLLGFVSIPYSAIALFWYAVIVVERKFFPGLIRAFKILLSNPYALILGIAWAGLSFADTTIFDVPGTQTSLPLNGIRAGVLAVGRILATVYALAIFKQIRGDVPDEVEETALSLKEPGDGLVNTSFGFAFAAFIPFIHLVTLILGIVALKRKKRFVLRAAIACCAGGFFTLLYALMTVGWFVNWSSPEMDPGYSFLAEANSELESHAALLEQGTILGIPLQSGQDTVDNAERHWTLDCLSALKKYQAYNLEGALEDFYIASEKEPERSEFYYYYGVALLEKGQPDMAATQFKNALSHEPPLEAAELHLNLINNTYNPPILISSVTLVIILLILFALHEYGHAFAAWKLGDDTAKDQGRLTLNPVAHLDLFGSIILPGILLWQQAGVVFGWAKPVPVNIANFKNPQRDNMRVSFAGPAVNLLIAMVSVLVLALLMLFIRLFWPETLALNLASPISPVSIAGPPFVQVFISIVVFFRQMFYTSLVLGFFNLLPIPPLDGSWILSGMLPEKGRYLFERIRPYSFVVFLLLVVTPVLDYILAIPMGMAWAGLGLLVTAMGFG